MAILTKDGQPYKLFSPPKPIPDNTINSKELEFHNFNWQTTVNKTNQRPLTVEPKPQSKHVTDFIELLKTSKKEIQEVAKEAVEKDLCHHEEPKPQPKEELPKVPVELSENAIQIHCLLAKEHEQVDEFYGETRKTVEYKKKFMFDALLLEMTGFEINLLTDCSELTKHSILYPSKFKTGEKLKHYRWWKISQIDKKQNGYLVTAILSDVQFDFAT